LRVAAINTTAKPNISSLLLTPPTAATPVSFGHEQKQDHQMLYLRNYLKPGILSDDPVLAKTPVASLLAIMDDTLYYIDPKCNKGFCATAPSRTYSDR